MRREITMACFTELRPGLKVETHEIECAVTIEPDEAMGDAAYYICGVEIEGRAPGKALRWHTLPEAHPLYAVIREYAYSYCRDELDELWAEYLADHPRRALRATDAEHRTHGGRL